MSKYVLCEVEYHFDTEQDQSMCRVAKPLQIFDDKIEAIDAMDIFNSFYNYDLRVVSSDDLDSTFR